MSREAEITFITPSNPSLWSYRQFRPGIAGLPPISLWRELLDCINKYVIVLDRNGINLWNNTLTSATGDNTSRWWGLSARIGECYLKPYQIAAVDGDGYAALALVGMQEVLGGRSHDYSMEYPYRLADQNCWFRLEATALTDMQGALVTLEEITDSKRMRRPLQCCRGCTRQQGAGLANPVTNDPAGCSSHLVDQTAGESGLHQAASVFVNSSEAMVITDAQRSIIRFNHALLEITGYASADVRGKDLQMLHAELLDKAFIQSIWQTLEREDHWQGEIWNRRCNGEPFPAWETIDVVRDDEGRLNHYVCLFSDISSIKASHSRLYYLAHHDSLTGLANRLLFWARLEQSLEHARRHRHGVALLFIDIDRFKQVNDSYGHKFGDQLLQAMAQRLMAQVRGEDTVARLGGDEFAIIATGVSKTEDAKTLVHKLNVAIGQPLQIQGRCFKPRASIGIGLYPEQGEDAESLYQAADEDMYRVKGARRNAQD